MKKSLLFIAVIAASMCANAQGKWLATGTEASVAAGTEIVTGITGLKVMHSDAAGVIGKTDTGAPVSIFNGVTYDNQAIVQGSTNNMYYAFKPSQNGVLSIAAKMGGAKPTYVIGIPTATSTDLASLTTTSVGILDLTGTNPVVTTTAIQSGVEVAVPTQAWSGTSMNPVSGSANMYVVMKFNVTANTIYAVAVTGSKFMLRGLSLTTTTGANNIPASKATVVSTEYYSITGAKLTQPGRGINLAKKTMSDGSVVTSKFVMSNSIR